MIDVSRLVWRRWVGLHPTGIDRVCLAYLEHFSANAQAVVQHRLARRILDTQASATLFQMLSEPSTDFRGRFLRQALRFASREACTGKGRLYLNIGHTGLDDPAFADWLRRRDVKPVYLVHDLIPITHPEYCRAGEKPRHRRRMTTVLQTGAGVIGNSQVTVDSLSDFARQEGLPQPPMTAAWLGTTRFARQARPPGDNGRPTFVILGTIEARKNHLMLLQVWTRIVERLGTNAPRLVIIGQRGWESEQAVDLLERSEALAGAVLEINHCSDEELASHLGSARALLFPSLVEGFGLPLIEALSAGTPAIASDLPVFREIGQGVADLVDPLDGPGWMRMIVDYARQDSAARAAQIHRLQSYRAPTWAGHFASVEEWLSQL